MECPIDTVPQKRPRRTVAANGQAETRHLPRRRIQSLQRLLRAVGENMDARLHRRSGGSPLLRRVRRSIRKNRSTLPTPPRNTGSVSKSSASAPVINIAGMEISTNGDQSCQSEIGRASGRSHCMANAAAISTSTMAASTAKLLTVFATVYISLRIGVAARMRPTRVAESRSTEFLTT